MSENSLTSDEGYRDEPFGKKKATVKHDSTQFIIHPTCMPSFDATPVFLYPYDFLKLLKSCGYSLQSAYNQNKGCSEVTVSTAGYGDP